MQSHSNLSALLRGVHLLGAGWIRIRMGAGDGYQLAAGDHVAVHFVLKGSVVVQSERGHSLSLRSGATALLPHGKAHVISGADSGGREAAFPCVSPSIQDIPPTINLSSDPSETTSVLAGFLKFDWPSAFPNRKHLPPILLGTRSYDGDRSAAASATRALEETASLPGANICLSRFAELLLARELRAFLATHPHLINGSNPNEIAIATALAAVRAQPEFPWSVESLARCVGMSRSSFAAKFSEIQNKTPMEAVTEIRLELAARFLREEKLKVKEVAAKVGYDSDTAFMRSFAKYFGMTPSSYRKNAGATDWVSLIY